SIKPIMGEGTIVGSYFEQTGLSIPFFLLAAAAFHESRALACAAWLAVGFNIDGMYGIFAASYLGAAFVIDGSYRRDWRRWIPAFLLFLLLASYAIFLGFSTVGGHGHVDGELWRLASRLRSWTHLYPMYWRMGHFLTFGLLLALSLLV